MIVRRRQEIERSRHPRPSFAEVYRAFRKRYPLAETGLDADFASSVRDLSPGRPVKV